MPTLRKFPVHLPSMTVELPGGSVARHVGVEDDYIYVWAEVRAALSTVSPSVIRGYHTDQDFPPWCRYVGTITHRLPNTEDMTVHFYDTGPKPATEQPWREPLY